MDIAEEGVLDVDMLGDDGSEDEGEAPPSSGEVEFYPGPTSTPTSCASSPRGEEPASPHAALGQPSFFHHQPYTRPFFTSARRGPGRPRKEGVKLAKEGKIVRRYRNPGSVRGAKKHRVSRDDALEDIMDEDDLSMPAPEEPPYFPEKWPGKLCALCNLGERSQLGQGEMRQFGCNIGELDGSSTPSASGGTTPTNATPTSAPSTPLLPGLVSPPPELVDPNQNPLAMPLSRRQKGFNKCKTPLYNMEHTDELSIIGHVDIVEMIAVVSNRTFYVHRFCLEFSPPFQDQVAAISNSEEEREQLEEARVKGVVTNALQKKCAFCLRHGASIPCKMSCSKYFHLPCVLASGGFMDFQTKSSFCKDHLYQVPLICAADIDCRMCRVVGDIANLMTCVACGAHYHGTCVGLAQLPDCRVCRVVGDIANLMTRVACGAHYHGTCVGLAQLPGVRSGWSCRACRVCQVCRLDAAPADARPVTCEHCDKLYHASCLRPAMATVPKYGWKCKVSVHCDKLYHASCLRPAMATVPKYGWKCKVSVHCDKLYHASCLRPAMATVPKYGWKCKVSVHCDKLYHASCLRPAMATVPKYGWKCKVSVHCDKLYHASCLRPAMATVPKYGWKCKVSVHCDKLYHASCLRPAMATVPKYGWKCKCCRICSDCGARSPGAGPSSRWHAHYTVCDSCYQQRNKGSCCPLCRRAYRAAAMRDMIRCHRCKRYVHGMCDIDADPQQYRLKKEQNPSYEYNCPICKTQAALSGGSKGSFEEPDSLATTSQDSSFGDENSQEQDPLAIEPKPDIGLGKGKPYTVSSKVAKKKMGSYKLKGGFPPAGKLGFQKRQRSSCLDFGRKRGSKPKMRGVFGVPGLGLQRPQAPDNKTAEDDPGVENKLVLCSSKDKFVLTQDLCVMCGAVGTDSEGCLIACSQCGQSYHPYCVNIKVSQVIVTLGWRCLDCTVCEGCGSRGDDALLVLCDDCDTAWHTYCAKPQLAEVPRGSWRCERCRKCLVCGTKDTAVWCDNYTECGPCASFVVCCVCSEPYSDGELIVQCGKCNRWLHGACDAMRLEAEAEANCAQGIYKHYTIYESIFSPSAKQSKPTTLFQIQLHPLPRARRAPASPGQSHRGAARPAPLRPPPPTPQSLGLGGEYYIDDVCLSQRGAQHMKQMEAEMGITHTRRKRRFKNETTEKDAVVQNNDGDADGEAKPDSTAEVKDEPGTIGNANFKEGILWNVASDGPPPEGFTIYTMDSGITVLRRKRQRNLNKLGIGGFVVRQRQNAKSHPDDDDTTLGPGESPGNKRKPRRKPRSKLMEQFPSYMQEAFFGKDLLEPAKPTVTSTVSCISSYTLLYFVNLKPPINSLKHRRFVSLTRYRSKPRSKLMEQFPSYMQEAFFGKDLLEPAKPTVTSTGNPLESPTGTIRPLTPEGYRELRDFKIELDNSDSDGEDVIAALTNVPDYDNSVVINLNTEEVDLLHSLKPKEEKEEGPSTNADGSARIKTECTEEGQLKHTEDSTALKNAILGPQANEPVVKTPVNTDSIPTVHSTKTEPISNETGNSSQASTISPKDDLSLLGVSLDAMVRDSLPDMDSTDVDEIFKGVLTDDSQESQESSVSYVNSMGGTPYSQQRQQLQSPLDYASPYHPEFGSR
ncbi:unnamed protein product [Plutella xylostella]|uniref:(diamondback moth) hypothetical protein n=1 Tax=Plutella xylostella TaxID=51655 RepID=A0A8S4FUR0_PLUXY|nr:unnamed protein product [Plutella xylostella]